jgi:TonB family protein
MLLGAGMSRPSPVGDCAPGGQRPKPPTPEQARQMGVTGTVLVEYVVHTDGTVGNVLLKNPTAPPILFESVRQWLATCHYTPSMAGGRPIPVKIIQPFIFRQQ